MPKDKADKASGEILPKDTEEPAAKRPVGMLARVSEVGEVDESTRELVLDISEHLYPGVVHLGQLPQEDRVRWIRLQSSLVRAVPKLNESDLESFRSIFEKAIEVQVSELLEIAEQVELTPLGLEEKRATALRERAKNRSKAEREIPPPPSSPTYDRLFGNQIRWAMHVIRYTLQQRRLRRFKSSGPETE